MKVQQRMHRHQRERQCLVPGRGRRRRAVRLTTPTRSRARPYGESTGRGRDGQRRLQVMTGPDRPGQRVGPVASRNLDHDLSAGLECRQQVILRQAGPHVPFDRLVPAVRRTVLRPAPPANLQESDHDLQPGAFDRLDQALDLQLRALRGFPSGEPRRHCHTELPAHPVLLGGGPVGIQHNPSYNRASATRRA